MNFQVANNGNMSTEAKKDLVNSHCKFQLNAKSEETSYRNISDLGEGVSIKLEPELVIIDNGYINRKHEPEHQLNKEVLLQPIAGENARKSDCKCNICLKEFSTKQSLQIHLRLHSGETPFECKICSKKFARSDTFRQHQQSHTGKSFCCKYCSKEFTRKADMIRHELLHSGEKPFNCSHCSRCFRQMTHLRRHEQTHNGIPRFQCDMCLRSFTDKSNFKRHYITHFSKLFACDYCERAFFHKPSLKRHLRRSNCKMRFFECFICKISMNLIDLRKHISIDH